MEAAIEDGKISVQMRGRKLKGSWSLVKTSTDWLLLKHDDPLADPDQDLTARDRSVVSGLSLDDIRAGRLPRHRKAPSDYTPAALKGARAAPLPDALTPMSASAREPFSHPDWLFEPKLDGIRAIAHVSGGEARLTSRRGTDLTATYPGLAATLAAQPVAEAVYDGEIVAFDERGVPSFELLQQRMNLAGEIDIAAAEEHVPVDLHGLRPPPPRRLRPDRGGPRRAQGGARPRPPPRRGHQPRRGAAGRGPGGLRRRRRPRARGRRRQAAGEPLPARQALRLLGEGEGPHDRRVRRLRLHPRRGPPRADLRRPPPRRPRPRRRARLPGARRRRLHRRPPRRPPRPPRRSYATDASPFRRDPARGRRRDLRPPRARRRGRVLGGDVAGAAARPRFQAPPPRQGP